MYLCISFSLRLVVASPEPCKRCQVARQPPEMAEVGIVTEDEGAINLLCGLHVAALQAA